MNTADFQIVTRDKHGDMRWRPVASFQFAAQDAVAALVVQEVPSAIMSFPVAFLISDDRYIPVALMGVTSGQNLFVAPDGEWLADYIPAVYRSYPFRLMEKNPDEYVLCVDGASGLLHRGIEGERFFQDSGEPSARVSEILELLTRIERDRKTTATACAALEKHGLIEPWPLTVQDGDEELQVGGLHRINEASLYQLSPECLCELRDSAALMLAYAQLFSVQHIHKLGPLVVKHANTLRAEQARMADISLSGDDGGSLSFDDLN
ncbi:SapC family protein [Pseudohongiella spirulinae]|uniref:SapC n=1 Tax=Pseudohongiella spirulinae TaxID=1249552 RepID=A0A0S2K9N2_9GAMM|nr:SapC family protein [Pseudohongiella spirulinae]ALO44771.1 SapC [Pseudohongiella spirulinae]